MNRIIRRLRWRLFTNAERKLIENALEVKRMRLAHVISTRAEGDLAETLLLEIIEVPDAE